MRNCFGARASGVLLLALAAAFAAGVAGLMVIRFEAGDVYAPYSSLRIDPLGTKAFYESLELMRGVSTTRNYKSLSRVEDAQDTTVFFFGISRGDLYSFDDETARAIESKAANGSRLIFMLYPEAKQKKDAKGKYIWTATEEAEKNGVAQKGPLAPLLKRIRFNIEAGCLPVWNAIGPLPSGTLVAGGSGLPESIPWHSTVCLRDEGGNWETIYAVEGHPVVMERQLGEGSIVLATDSYLVSNEALRFDRNPQLLTWLVGGKSSVMFDEFHLGVMEQPGIASLLRKYNLHGLVAGIFALAVLFVWKTSSSLVPPQEAPEGSAQAGSDYGAGVVSLLRRNIPSGRVLEVCFEEWGKAFPGKKKERASEMDRIRKVLQTGKNRKDGRRGSVDGYRDISKILSERKYI